MQMSESTLSVFQSIGATAAQEAFTRVREVNPQLHSLDFDLVSPTIERAEDGDEYVCYRLSWQAKMNDGTRFGITVASTEDFLEIGEEWLGMNYSQVLVDRLELWTTAAPFVIPAF
jgi:hypothetical protein